MRREFQSIHWSQLVAGDVVQATRTIYTKVERVDHHSDTHLLVWGVDETGARKGQATSRLVDRRGVDGFVGVLLIYKRNH
jgi:hypothetical protein